MNDERDEQLDRLFRTVRALKPDTATVETGFETRLLAAIERRRNDQALWSFWTWRLVPTFALIAIVVGVISVAADPGRSGDLFTLLAPNGYDDYQATNLLVGG